MKVHFQRLTCVEDLDDGRGLVDVQHDTVEPAVLHQEGEDVEAVVQGAPGLGLEAAGFVRVILGPEPVSRVGSKKKKSGEGMTGGRVGMNGM